MIAKAMALTRRSLLVMSAGGDGGLEGHVRPPAQTGQSGGSERTIAMMTNTTVFDASG